MKEAIKVSQLRKLIEQRIAESKQLVVVGVYNNLVDSHNDINCNCEHCELLRKYVSCKILLTKKERNYTNTDWDDYWYEFKFGAVRSYAIDLPWEIRMLRLYISGYKEQRRQIKEQAKL